LSELHRFLFDGLPVRGSIVRLTDAWTEILERRRRGTGGEWPHPVVELVGEMAAAGTLMQSNIKFNGSLVLQIFGDGPVKVAVAEVQHDLSLRATAKVVGPVAADARLAEMVNVSNKGRCAITLDPREKFPGQQAYQGMVPLHGDHREKIQHFGDVLGHYMLQSEQLDTKLVLAADEKVAAGLLIQRLPVPGQESENEIGRNEDYNRIATLAGTLTRQELLELDVDTVLRRLFWEEKLMQFPPQRPHFACTCSRERVGAMIRGLGREEADSIVAEQGEIDVACDFCGQQYRFDAVDAAQLFAAPGDQPPVSSGVQ
jgi:molecular chaperone Hsp33